MGTTLFHKVWYPSNPFFREKGENGSMRKKSSDRVTYLSFRRVVIYILVLFCCDFLHGQNLQHSLSSLSSMIRPRDYQPERILCYDRTGINVDRIDVGTVESVVLADIACAGIIRHIWATIACFDPVMQRNAILRMYCDSEIHPSVESPIGDSFRNECTEQYNFISLPLATAPMEDQAMNCYFPMPFSNGARITFENQSTNTIRCLYYVIYYEAHEKIANSIGRFYVWWNRELSDKKSCRATIGHGYYNCLTLDICTVAYWYQVEPHKPFPEILPKDKRQNFPPIGPRMIHKWRDAWRQAMGGKVLWGNEE